MALNFLELPRELRDIVYEYLLNTTYTPCPSALDKRKTHTNTDSPKRRRRLELLLACRTIYDEATEVFYEKATFRFSIGGRAVSTLSLPPKIPARIQNIELRWRFGDREGFDNCWCAWSSKFTSHFDPECSVRGILKDLQDGTSRGQSCTIILVPENDCSLSTVGRLIDVILGFKRFRKLTLKYCTQPSIHNGRWRLRNDEYHEYVVEELVPTFGRPVRVRNLVTQSLIFTPQHW